MAKNRYSASCLMISEFDAYLKENYFPLNSNGGVCNIRGTLMEHYSDKEELSPDRIEEITEKLQSKETLSEEDKTFIEKYVETVNALLKDEKFQDKVKERLAKAGIKRNAVSTMYATYKAKFPAEHRFEILMQIVSIVIRNLDTMESWEEYEHFSRAEILEDYGIENLMEAVHDDLAEILKTIDNPTKEQKDIFDTLLNDKEALEAIFFMARTKLFEAEKLKIGIETEEVTEEDTGVQINSREIQDAEYQGPEHWMLKADTVSSFGSMSKENRSILYKLTTEKKGILGVPSIVNTMLIHQQLLELREEKACTNSVEFLNALDAVDTPWARQLYRILKNNVYRRTSFFNNHRRNHLNYLSLKKGTHRDCAGPVYYEETNKPDSRIPYQVYVAEALTKIEDAKSFLFNSDGKVNKDNVRNLVERLVEETIFNDAGDKIPPVYISYEGGATFDISRWNPNIGKDPLHPTDKEIEEKKRDFINTMNLALNFRLDKIDIDNLMEAKKFDTFMRNTILLVVSDIYGGGIDSFSELVERPVYYKHLKNATAISKPHISVADREMPVEGIFRFNGSTYMTHTVCNFIGDNLEKIRKYAKEAINKKDINIFKEFIEREYLKCRVYATKVGNEYKIHNYWVKLLYESTLDDLKSDNSFYSKLTTSLQRAVGMDEKDFENFNEKEAYILYLNSYLNTFKDTGKKFGKFPLFVTGDSNSTRLLTVPILSKEEILNNLTDIALQEMERMQMFRDFVDWCKSTKDGKPEYSVPKVIENKTDKFTLLPFLNNVDEDLIGLYNIDKERFRVKVRNLTEERLLGKNGDYDKWIKELSTSKSQRDNPIVSRLSNGTINTSVLNIPGINTNNISLLVEYYLNYRYAMIQQLQFLTVDPGFYDGTNDMQKRYKEMIAAGTPLDIEALDPADKEGKTKIDDNNGNQDVVYIEDQFFDTNEDVKTALKEAGFKETDIEKSFSKSNGTDGQAYRTFTSYRKICIMLGKWTEEMEEAWTIIQGARDRAKAEGKTSRLNDRELEKIMNLGVVFQPIKPFYYGIERIDTNNGEGEIQIPVQHKCSEFPIIPELLPENSPLAKLGIAMEYSSEAEGKKSYDLVICNSAVKTKGSIFGSISIKDLSDVNSIRESLDKGYRHVLPLENWREQSNVPEHADCSRARGTQLILHWLSNIAGTINKKYEFLQRLFPSGIVKLTKNSSIDISGGLNEGSLIKLFNVLAGFGAIKSCTQMVRELSNPNKMSDLLSTMRANDSRASNDNIDAYTVEDSGEMRISPSEGDTATENMAAFLSNIRKKIVKQGMKGGSLVQVATYGFQDILRIHTEKTKEGKTNITYADCIAPFDLSVTDENGNLVKLRYQDYVDYNTGNLLKANGKAFTDEEIADLEAKGIDWRKQTKLEQEFPEILDMLAYRIPTEGHCSVLNLKIRKFLPITSGGCIMVPALYTTIAGFDFDIDKLYFIRREFKARKLSKEENEARINRIWNDIYKKPNAHSRGSSWIYKRLKEAQEREKAKIEEARATEPDEVVAQSSEFKPNTLGDLIDAESILSKFGMTSAEETGSHIDGIEDNSNEATKPQKEESNEISRANRENERLFQYWEAAGLNGAENLDDPEKGGTGMTAQEYFEWYLRRNLTKYIEYQKLNENAPLMQQPQAVINNILFSFYKSRLEDYDTFHERVTPSGFDRLKRAKPIMLAIRYALREGLKDEFAKITTFSKLVDFAKEHFNNYEINYDATEPSTLVHYQVQNAMYDALIGIAANQNINQKYTALMEIFKLKNPIKWGVMLESNDAGMGSDVKKRFMNAVDAQTREAIILDTEKSSKENLGASVDAVKDALLEFFGVTINNFNLVSFAGKIGASPEDLGLLMNQPVVTIAMGIIASNPGYTELSDALYLALQELSSKEEAEEYTTKILPTMKKTQKGANTNMDSLVTLDSLTKSIIAYAVSTNGKMSSNKEFMETQVAVVSLLQELQNGATVLSDEINVTKTTSVNSVQSDFGSVEATEQRTEALNKQMEDPNFPFELVVTSTSPELSHTIINPYARIHQGDEESFVDRFMGSAFGLAQIFYSSVMTVVDDVISRYFPYRTGGFKEVKNVLATFTNRGKLNKDIINAANKFIITYCLEKMVPLFSEQHYPEIVGLNGETFRINMPNSIFYTNYFPQLLMSILGMNARLYKDRKAPILYSDIPILKYFTPRQQGTTKGYNNSNVILKAETIGKLQKEDKDFYIESWEQMFKSQDPILQNIALHLFMYSYYVGGIEFSPLTIMSLAPLALKMALGSTNESSRTSYANFFKRVFNLTPTVDQAELVENGAACNTRISIKNLLKSFIVNNCRTFRQFGMTVNDSDDLYQQIKDRLIDNGTKFKIDFTRDDNDLSIKKLISEIITDDEKEVIGYKVKPCVIIDGDIFICDVDWDNSNRVNFNRCKSTITYYKVLPSICKSSSDIKKVGEVADADYRKMVAEVNERLNRQFTSELEKIDEGEVGNMNDDSNTETTDTDVTRAANNTRDACAIFLSSLRTAVNKTYKDKEDLNDIVAEVDRIGITLQNLIARILSGESSVDDALKFMTTPVLSNEGLKTFNDDNLINLRDKAINSFEALKFAINITAVTDLSTLNEYSLKTVGEFNDLGSKFLDSLKKTKQDISDSVKQQLITSLSRISSLLADGNYNDIEILNLLEMLRVILSDTMIDMLNPELALSANKLFGFLNRHKATNNDLTSTLTQDAEDAAKNPLEKACD